MTRDSNEPTEFNPIDAIRLRVEAYESAVNTQDWVTAKCQLETQAARDLRLLLDYIDRHVLGHTSRAGQFVMEL